MKNKTKTLKLIQRFYGDFLMPSRLNEYRNILKNSIDLGYRFITFENFAKLINNYGFDEQSKYFILRHDIDLDIVTTRLIFEIERELKIQSSYYFRLSTLDINLMKEINRFGSEASYHYEEIAAYSKRFHIKDIKLIQENMNNIRQIFINNFYEIEKKLGYKLITVAAHGDFVNRYLGILNYELLNNEIRNELGIIADAYDPIIIRHQYARISDLPYPDFYTPYPLKDALNENLNPIYLLIHPNHWRVNIKENLKENIHRIYEGLKYSNFKV